MAFSVLLVDYCSIETTLKYIDLCNEKMKSKDPIQFFITDVSPEAKGWAYLKDNLTEVSNRPIKSKTLYEYEYHGKSIYCIPAYENLGYARGNNLAAAASIVLFPDNHLLVSNNDILFEQDCDLDEVDSYFTDLDYAVAGPDIIQHGQHMNPMYQNPPSYYMFLIYLNTVLPKKLPVPYNNTRYAFSGCFWFFNVKHFAWVQGFDEGTFMYFEEQIMEERMHSIGAKFHYLRDMKVIHDHSTKRQTCKAAVKYINTIHRSCNHYVKYYLKPNPIMYGLSNLCFYVLMVPFVIERWIRDLIYKVKN
ncbi:Glycosyltransferase, GT2 family [Pseudobutyrivibrio sp. YE44]|uniref:hypothetical protein n=1 Tax=Pseudobutyrivibrio sp. YE44 TaxID=1520802 RepID=UPI0008820D33|nr:hypothetical protein [Pseudobutyrivibrio sp. YE44]SDB56268.1 Glycosyltransferase, GT2 family [Pseudobutyrivibrio sp. YE44]